MKRGRNGWVIHNWKEIDRWFKLIGTEHAIKWLKAERDELRDDVDKLKEQMKNV